MSRPQLNDLVLDALRELAESAREYRGTFTRDENLDEPDPKREAKRHEAFDRHRDAQEQLETLALGLFPKRRATSKRGAR